MGKHLLQAVAEDRGFKVFSVSGCLGVIIGPRSSTADAVGVFTASFLKNADNLTEAELLEFGKAIVTVKRSVHPQGTLLTFPSITFDRDVEYHG